MHLLRLTAREEGDTTRTIYVNPEHIVRMYELSSVDGGTVTYIGFVNSYAYVTETTDEILRGIDTLGLFTANT